MASATTQGELKANFDFSYFGLGLSFSILAWYELWPWHSANYLREHGRIFLAYDRIAIELFPFDLLTRT